MRAPTSPLRVLLIVSLLAVASCGDPTAPPAGFAIFAGNNQSGIAGNALAVAPAVKVVDASGGGVAGVAVEFTVTSGNGTVTGGTATSDANGVAAVGSWVLGKLMAANTLKATVPDLATQPAVTFSAAATPGPATQLIVITQPGEAVNNTPLTVAPVVQARDANLNLATTTSIAVTASIAAGGGTVGGTSTVSTVDGVATFSNIILTGLTGTAASSLKFTAPSVAAATSSNFTTYDVPPLNLTLDGAYIVQSTQTYAGTVPLIAGRPGLIRVFAKAGITNTAAPSVRVRLYQSGTLVQTYTIPAPASSTPTVINEGTLGTSWNIAVPANLMVSGLSMLADVDPTNAVPESSESDNTFPASGTPLALDVRTTPPFMAMLVPVTQPIVAPATTALTGDATAASKDAIMDFFYRVYPISSYDVTIHAPYQYSSMISSAYDPTWNNLLSEMNALRLAEGSTRFYYGMIKPSFTSGGTGLGFLGVAAAIGVDWLTTVQPASNIRSMTAAHEWGHNFNRRHVNCGGPDPNSLDGAYPYNTASTGVFGYDITLSAVRATTNADLMSYCSPLWISDYTYKAVLTVRGSTPGPIATSGPVHGLLVWGHVGPDGVVLEPSFEVDAPPSLPTQAGPMQLRATDDAGQEIFNLSFDGAELDHMSNMRHFAFVVPLNGNDRPSELRLSAGGKEAVRRTSVSSLSQAGPSTALASVRLRSMTLSRSRLEWDAASYPMAMVRDPATGQILSFARGGQVDLRVPGQELDVTFSDGVSSARRAVRITPR